MAVRTKSKLSLWAKGRQLVRSHGIAAKILMGMTVAILALIGISGVTNYVSISQVQRHVDKLVSTTSADQALAEVKALCLHVDRIQKLYLLEDRAAERKNIGSDLLGRIDELKGSFRAFRRVFATPEQKNALGPVAR